MSKVSQRLTEEYQQTCLFLGVEYNPYMIQFGCLVVNSAHSWRGGYLFSDFYERNRMAMDIILRGTSVPSEPPLLSPGVAVVSPTKRDNVVIDEEPIPADLDASSKGDDSVLVSVGSPSEVSLNAGNVSPGNVITSAGPSGVASRESPHSDGDDDRLTPAILQGIKSHRDHPVLVLDDFDLLCATFGRRELQELLEMSSSEEDAPEVFLTVAEFRARMAKPKRYIHRGKYIPYYGAGGERSDNRGQWYHHCNVCSKQFTTRASVNRHLNPAQENSHPGCFIAFDDKYPQIGEDGTHIKYRLGDLQRDFPHPVACHRLKCAVEHCKTGTAVTRVKPVKRTERTKSIKKPVELSDDDTESDDATAPSPRSVRQRSLDKKYRLALRLDQKGQKRRRK